MHGEKMDLCDRCLKRGRKKRKENKQIINKMITKKQMDGEMDGTNQWDGWIDGWNKTTG